MKENNNKIDVLKIVRQYDNQFKQHMLKLKQIEEKENKMNLNDINKELENIKKQQQSNNFIQKLKQNSINKNLNKFNNHTDNYKNYVLNQLMYSEENDEDQFDENNNSMEISNEDNNNKLDNLNNIENNNKNINNNINAFSFNQKINVPETIETNDENEVLNNNNNNNQTDTNGNLVNYDSNIINIKNSNLKTNNNPANINNIKNNRIVKFEPIEKEFNSKESKLSEFLQNFKNKELELKQQKEFEEQLKQNLMNEENNITETHRKNLGKVIEQYIDESDSEKKENFEEEEEENENNIYENYFLKNNNKINEKIPVDSSNQKIKSKNHFKLNAKDKINLAIKENQGKAKYTAQTYSAIQKMNKPYKKPIKKPGIFEKKILNKKYKGKTDRVAINNMYNDVWKKNKHKL